MESITITYETLFDLLRREKSRDALQPLEPEFYEAVERYLKAKVEDAKALPFSDQQTTRRQLENAHKIIKELFERREKKILLLALAKTRAGMPVDESTFLREEHYLYQELNRVLGQFTHSILEPLLDANSQRTTSNNAHNEIQPITHKSASIQLANNSQYDPSGTQTTQNLSLVKLDDNSKEKDGSLLKSNVPSESSTTDDTPAETTAFKEGKTLAESLQTMSESVMKIKMRHAIPKFLGKNLETYGPFDPGTIAELPTTIANLLVDKGRAEKV